ncbi:MAG: hypothetical protein ACJ8AS_11460 [Hyphomicrobiales bacterium]
MQAGATVLGVLRRARDLVQSGRSEGILAAISSLGEEASGPTRDLAYFAIMDTIELDGRAGSIEGLAAEGSRAGILRLFDATIQRITSALH